MWRPTQQETSTITALEQGLTVLKTRPKRWGAVSRNFGRASCDPLTPALSQERVLRVCSPGPRVWLENVEEGPGGGPPGGLPNAPRGHSDVY
jgi:hypothetical protein